MTTVAVILARGGSKRLPGKNVRPLHGRPLIAYTIDAARGAALLDRVIVSTDDPEIARVAAGHGAEVPFLRPAELATDDSPPTAALAHAVGWLERNGQPVDTIVLLQATSPLRGSADIDGAIALFRRAGVDTVTAVSPAPAHPYWCWRPHGDEIEPFFSAEHISMPRAALPPALIENGAVYVFRRSLLVSGTLYGARVAGYPMDAADAVDIDTLEDFEYAEFLLGRRAAHRQQPR